MRRVVGWKLPGTHAVRIMLGAALLAVVAAVIAARNPDDSEGRGNVADALVAQPGSTATQGGSTPGSTATTAQEERINTEGAVPEPAPQALPGTAQAATSNSRFQFPLRS